RLDLLLQVVQQSLAVDHFASPSTPLATTSPDPRWALPTHVSGSWIHSPRPAWYGTAACPSRGSRNGSFCGTRSHSPRPPRRAADASRSRTPIASYLANTPASVSRTGPRPPPPPLPSSSAIRGSTEPHAVRAYSANRSAPFEPGSAASALSRVSQVGLVPGVT